jgi:hypothetical protein
MLIYAASETRLLGQRRNPASMIDFTKLVSLDFF